MIKVSIITTSFNSEKYIADCIRSVNMQSYPNIEHIIIDGNSKDNTVKIIEENRSKKSKFICEKDNGPYDAFNKGIKQATGDFVGFVHSDDMLVSKDVITKLVVTIMEQGKDAIYGDLNFVNAKNTDMIIRKWVSGDFNRSRFYFGWMPPHPTLYIKKSIYNKLGYYNETQSADYELIIRFFCKHQISCTYLNETIYIMRAGGKSNLSISNRLQAHKCDWLAWLENDISIFPIWVILKPLRKIYQYFCNR